MQKPLIIANWKMNPATLQEAQKLYSAVEGGITDINTVDIILCPPFGYLSNLKGNAQLGAQDCFWENPTGAYTGEISASMLKDLGCAYVILGHSERKMYLGETLSVVNKKVKAALDSDLMPVVCIGEKKHGDNASELNMQTEQLLEGISTQDASKIVLVYEPEWAISSNENAQPASPQDCKAAIGILRAGVAKIFGDTVAHQTKILYGGSTDSTNIAAFMRKGGAQGALVGAASLQAKEFLAIIENSVYHMEM